MRVALLGFGLIGGSIARALRREAGDWTIAAWSPSGVGPRLARAEELIDEASPTPADAVRGADLVVLAASAARVPRPWSTTWPARWPSRSAPDALVTDVASTKSAIGARADAAGLRFVGGHPMAGREAAATGRPRRTCSSTGRGSSCRRATAHAGDPGRVEALAAACGARPVG